jgi:hypothetical protein
MTELLQCTERCAQSGRLSVQSLRNADRWQSTSDHQTGLKRSGWIRPLT